MSYLWLESPPYEYSGKSTASSICETPIFIIRVQSQSWNSKSFFVTPLPTETHYGEKLALIWNWAKAIRVWSQSKAENSSLFARLNFLLNFVKLFQFIIQEYIFWMLAAFVISIIALNKLEDFYSGSNTLQIHSQNKTGLEWIPGLVLDPGYGHWGFTYARSHRCSTIFVRRFSNHIFFILMR